ncbi:hypothetical protein HQ587_08765 [bacterium]|nr:hypothetical protein [bacterium]
MLKQLKITTIALFAVMISGLLVQPVISRTIDAGPVRDKGEHAGIAAAGIKDRFVHDVGNVRMTLSNWGEQGNPDALPGFFGFEFPFGSENDFLFSSGIWIGAIKNNQRLVSTGTDGDDGTNDFVPSFDRYIATSKQYSDLAGRTYIMGAKGIDDDEDWWDNPEADLDGNGEPSVNWDGGEGFIGRDDDEDGFTDEDSIVVDTGEIIWGPGETDRVDTGKSGDANGDGNCNYDPEPFIDEDPVGDISHDFIDNDFDGYVDMDDEYPPGDQSKWYDGDAIPGSLDDDDDGLEDEDGNARGTQEYFCAYDDSDPAGSVNPDPDGHTPLNVMVLQRTYAWGEAYAGAFILVDLIIRNIGDGAITDVHIGLFADADVAAKGESGDPASVDDWNYYWDDVYPPDTDKGEKPLLMMVHGDDSTDADGFGPGLFAMKIVRTPAPPESLNIVFKNFERVSGGDPDLNTDKFDMLSDDPSNNSPPTAELGDWRFLLGFAPSEGRWTLRPGEELPVTVAFIAGYDIPDIKKNAEWAQAMYDNDFQGPAAPDQPEFGNTLDLSEYAALPGQPQGGMQLFPDHIRIFWMDNSEESVDPITKDYDFEGYVIQRSSDMNYWWTMKQYDIINVLPNPEFQRENLNLGMPYDLNPIPGTTVNHTGWDWVVVETIDTTVTPPDTTIDSSRVYWYDDYDVLRGWTYYYIVRAFDQGVKGAGVLITAIGRSFQEATVGCTEENSPLGSSVDAVCVVPNPYRGSHEEEYGGALTKDDVKHYPRKLKFMNLPASGATIRIYTLAGDHLITLKHQPGIDLIYWDMRNKYAQEIVSGIYYYVVEGWVKDTDGTIDEEGGPIKIDKFVVLK